MCGIAGIIALNNEPSCPVDAVYKMGKSMQNRGPDDEGYVAIHTKNRQARLFHGRDTAEEVPALYNSASIDEANESATVVFGHRRLSILDLTPNSHQPMTAFDGKLWIVFNGEIYNYATIRSMLEQAGHQFRTKGDTEVLLHAYKEWGEKCLEKLNGMFAFAIYDESKQQVFMARDRIGIKPLYYSIQNNRLLFASDIKAMIASEMYEPEVDWEGFWHALSLSMAPRPMTCFKDVSALEQGHWMLIDLENGNITKEKYWEVPLHCQEESMSLEDAVGLLEQELKRSIQHRLVADVEVGSFMSGGIDSTTISAMASKEHSGIKAFTLGFDNVAAFDEVEQAKATARMNDIEHIVKLVQPEELLRHIDEMVLGYEEPFEMLAPNYIISRLVAENNIKVVLNGLGGDELFAGYSYFKTARKWRMAKNISWALQLIPDGINYKLDTLKRLSRYQKIDQYYVGIKSYSLRNEEEKRKLFKQQFSFDSLSVLSRLYGPEGRTFTDDIEAVSYYDLMNYIGNHHVHRVDQFTMMFSLEGRVPFLDHNLVEAAMRIPSKYKIHQGVQKFVLRKVAEKYIAPECLSMKKKGFSLPMKHWMNNQLKELTRDSLEKLKQRGVFHPEEIDRIYKKYHNTHYKKVWQLVMIELWFQQFMDGGYLKSLR